MMASFLAGFRKLTKLFVTVRAGVAQSVQRPGYGLIDRGSLLDGDSDGIFSLRHRVQTGFGSHPASYQMGTGSSYYRGKAAWA
jgi:hypothetical protein